MLARSYDTAPPFVHNGCLVTLAVVRGTVTFVTDVVTQSVTARRLVTAL